MRPNNISIGRRSVAPSKSRNANRYTASPRPSEANITPIPINPSVRRSLDRGAKDDCSLSQFCTIAIPPPIWREIGSNYFTPGRLVRVVDITELELWNAPGSVNEGWTEISFRTPAALSENSQPTSPTHPSQTTRKDGAPPVW